MPSKGTRTVLARHPATRAEQSAAADGSLFIGFPRIVPSRPPLLSFGVRPRQNAMLREHAFETMMERRLFSIDIPSAAALPRLDLPAGNFACHLAWDARGASADAVSAFVEPLLDASASYFVCWGPDCERVHDIIDEMVSYPHHDFGVPNNSCIMTTWHASEPLREALWFFLVNSRPDEYYEDSTHMALAISVGSSAWAEEITQALDHPREFIRRGSEDGAA